MLQNDTSASDQPLSCPARAPSRGHRREEAATDATGLALSPIRRTSLRERVHATLRAAIISGKLPRDRRLNERALAAELAISTSPLKEALRQLEAEGLVRVVPRKGTFVTFNARQAREMSLARAALESIITRQAARHGTDAHFDALRATIEQMRVASADADADRLIALNERFHGTIHEASGCDYLCRLQKAQSTYDHATRVTVLTVPEIRRRSFHEHRAIMEAVTRRDADEAERLMRDHVIVAGQEHVALVFGATTTAETAAETAIVTGEE